MTAGAIDLSIKELIESDIFDYLELNSLTPEEKEAMIQNLVISLRSRVMLRIADILEETGEFEKFKSLLGGVNTADEEVVEFLVSHEIQVDALAADEALRLKAEVMGYKQS
ncbi:MAG: hypothetical protein WC844_05090 [Patescibacteria group bacterium]